MDRIERRFKGKTSGSRRVLDPLELACYPTMDLAICRAAPV